MELSFILPAYNVEQWLEKCVVSCESQDIDRSLYEVIIVNDGSTDSTLAIAERLRKQYYNITVISQHNQGLSMARNNGAAAAQGRYIWFVDSDDYISRNCLGSIIRLADNYKLDMLGVAPMIPFREEFPPISIDIDTHIISKVYTGTQWLVNKSFFVGAWGYVFRRDFWEKSGLRFYPGICFEDTELMPKIIFKAKRLAVFTQFSCYQYVQRAGSIMNSPMSKKKIFDMATIINSTFEFMQRDEEIQKNPAMLSFMEAQCSMQFLAGVKNIKRIGDSELLKPWLDTLKKRPHKLYGKNFMERAYQYMVLNHPKIFIKWLP